MGDNSTTPIKRSLATLNTDPRWHRLDDTAELAILAHKLALTFVSARWSDKESKHTASCYSTRAVNVLTRLAGLGSRDAQQWIQQADMVNQVISAKRSARVSDHEFG